MAKNKKRVNSKKKKSKALLLIVLLLIIVAVIFIFQKKNTKPAIELIGDSKITINIGEEYKEEGAKAFINGKEVDTQIKGSIDTSIPGEYLFTYSATNETNGKTNTISRIVVVIDNIPPVIKLNGRENIELMFGKEYKEEGATATDNVDGDITDQIKTNGNVDSSKEGTYEIEYSVTDKAGNVITAKRTVVVKAKPTAILKNGLPVLMYHFFYDKGERNAPDDNWIEISDFEAQMAYLEENDFYFPTWDEVEEYIDGKIDLPEKSIVLTVDDGDPSFFELAVPIIQKHNVQATSFIITEWYGYRANNKESNISYQSHSESMHEGVNGKGVILSWPYNKIVADLKESRDCLGEDAIVFCYPFGHYDENAKKAVKDAGFKLAFTVEGGRVKKGADKFALPRVRISRKTSLESFKNMVK